MPRLGFKILKRKNKPAAGESGNDDDHHIDGDVQNQQADIPQAQAHMVTQNMTPPIERTGFIRSSTIAAPAPARATLESFAAPVPIPSRTSFARRGVSESFARNISVGSSTNNGSNEQYYQNHFNQQVQSLSPHQNLYQGQEIYNFTEDHNDVIDGVYEAQVVGQGQTAYAVQESFGEDGSLYAIPASILGSQIDNSVIPASVVEMEEYDDEYGSAPVQISQHVNFVTQSRATNNEDPHSTIVLDVDGQHNNNNNSSVAVLQQTWVSPTSHRVTDAPSVTPVTAVLVVNDAVDDCEEKMDDSSRSASHWNSNGQLKMQDDAPLWGKKPQQTKSLLGDESGKASSAPWSKKSEKSLRVQGTTGGLVSDSDTSVGLRRQSSKYKVTFDEEQIKMHASMSASPFNSQENDALGRDDYRTKQPKSPQHVSFQPPIISKSDVSSLPWGRPAADKKLMSSEESSVNHFPSSPAANNMTPAASNMPLWGKPPTKTSLTKDTETFSSLKKSPAGEGPVNIAHHQSAPLWGTPSKSKLENNNEPSNGSFLRSDQGTTSEGISRIKKSPPWVAAEQNDASNAQGFSNPSKTWDDTTNASNQPLWGKPSKQNLVNGDTKNTTFSTEVNIMDGDSSFAAASESMNRKPPPAWVKPAVESDANLSQISASVAKLPGNIHDDDSCTSSSEVPPLNQGKGSDGGSSLPLYGKKAKKYASLEDEPDYKEIAFAESSALLGSTSLSATLKSDQNPEKTEISTTPEEPPEKNNAHWHSSANMSESCRLDVNIEGLSEEEMLKRAIMASQEDQSTPTKKMTQEEIEDARENARTIRNLVRNDDVDAAFLQNALGLCEQDYEKVSKGIENAMISPDDETSIDSNYLEILIDLIGDINEALESGKRMIRNNQKPESKKKKVNLDVEDLVRKKDVFSLICMLRVHDKGKRLDTALALMKFARLAEREGGAENIRVREDIRSSGGLHSLLTLFRGRETFYELKVVVALAVAYVLPSFVESSSQTPPSLGLKIVECLRFLVTNPRPVSPQGTSVDVNEMYYASSVALTNFWVNHLEPMLSSKKTTSMLTNAKHDSNHGLERKVSSGSRLRVSRATSVQGAPSIDMRQEAIALDELLEMTVALIIHFAKRDQITGVGSAIDNYPIAAESLTCTYTLVEQVCAVEIARPIAVRGGILQILVSWIGSKDLDHIRPAASALQYLTSIQDSYMAGWIHSEMVNKGAVKGLADLTHDISVTHDVRVAIVRILSSLCTAPHTRAAVVDEKNCISFLIGFLYEHCDSSSQEAAAFACKAILQLAAGAIARSSAFGDEELERTSADKRDTLVDDIVESGVIASFVSIALNGSGRLRLVAVQALRVMSEDISPIRQTRLQLCDDSAAQALGVTLHDDVSKVEDLLSNELPETLERQEQQLLEEIHESLCALANILDAIHDTAPTAKNRRARSSFAPQERLMKGCRDTATSGGLGSLLKIASIPFLSTSKPHTVWHRNMELVEESCRSLALISPLLLSKSIAAEGYSKWALDLLLALQKVLKQIVSIENIAQKADRIVDLYVNVLQGMSAIARSDPLKVKILDTSLPYLLQSKGVTEPVDISNAASQVFQTLGFAEGEDAVHRAGNNPDLHADWFCLQRSLLLQAMVRAEIRHLILSIWNVPFKQTSNNPSIKLIRDISSSSSMIGGSFISVDNDLSFFENFADDHDTLSQRESLLIQYKEIYEGRDVVDSSLDINVGLLAKQIYPLNSTASETDWILRHGRFIENAASDESLTSMSEHAKKFMSYCFPSKLLRDQVIPIKILKPDASFNFRAFMMPRKRYFSFQREGQLLSRLCEKESVQYADLSNAHWTLGFRNSSFSGEFSETLVQVLYLCPMIRGLSFSVTIDVPDFRESESDSKENQNDDRWGGLLLSTLAGSLPNWITHLTFDGVFRDAELINFVSLLETMGKLSASPDITGVQVQTKGKFLFLAICNSPNISGANWLSFVNILGSKGPLYKSPSSKPLASLKALDLSGNKLGDEMCASILEISHSFDSKCCLEKLDLSGNCIRYAGNVLRVLRLYALNRMAAQDGGRGWKSPLQTLYLSSNEMHLSKTWLELLALLQNDGLSLVSLDLSGNDLFLTDNERDYTNVIAEALWSNSSLCSLNLSRNKFSESSIDYILKCLDKKDYNLTIVSFDGNTPKLQNNYTDLLKSIAVKARCNAIQKYYYEAEQISRDKPEEELDVNTPSKTPNPHNNYNIHQKISLTGVVSKDIVENTGSSQGDNMITVLFSAPLVFNDGKMHRALPKLDFEMERELMWQCLKEASRDIELSFDSATHDRLLATIAKRCSCLHYSGHGHEEYLPFEDGSGGPYWFKVEHFKSLIAKEGGAPFRFVFVSACHSYLAGATFASAGVPHVVCCKQESELKDTAALAFTRQFYLALSIGHTVRDSFEQGCKAVRATPNLKNPDLEMKKFVLLPENGNHDVPIFNAKPLSEWPKPSNEDNSKSRRKSGKGKGLYSGGAKSSELSVRNMMQEDPSPSPPQFFLGREVDLYYVLKAVLGKRLVSIIGEPGVGRSSVACALCHYINERASTIIAIERIYYVKARRSRKKNPLKSLVMQLMNKLFEDEKAKQSDKDADMETMFDEICDILKKEKALIVFDRAEIVSDSEEASEFHILLSKLCRETKFIKVLLTNREPLGIPSLGEHPVNLGPLNFADTVRLFSKNCPYVHTPVDRERLFKNLVVNNEEGELLATDPGLGDTTKKIFEVIGEGIPSRIEKAAYDLTKEDFLRLQSRKV